VSKIDSTRLGSLKSTWVDSLPGLITNYLVQQEPEHAHIPTTGIKIDKNKTYHV